MTHTGPKRLTWMLAAMASLPGAAGAVNPPNPVCLNEQEFIEQARQSMSPAAFKLMYDPTAAHSMLRTVKPMLDQTATLEQAAAGGDAKARAELATTWAECRLDGFEYSQEKQALARDYLRAQFEAEKKPRTAYLMAMYEVLGWNGQPASLQRAYPLLVQAGLKTSDTAPAPDAADSANRNGRTVKEIALQRLLKGRFSYAKKLFTSPLSGAATPAAVVASYAPCEKTMQLPATPPQVNREMLVQLLDGVAALLPSDGLDCKQPPLSVPLTFAAPPRS